MIWHQIQAGKTDKRDLHVIFLDLEIAFCSVPQELLWKFFTFSHVLEPITTLIKTYLNTCDSQQPTLLKFTGLLPSGYLESCMKIKPSLKASPLSKGCQQTQVSSSVMTQYQQSLSLGKSYNASLKDKEQVQQLKQEIVNGLETINKILLPGKLKLWCLQFRLFPQTMWPLTIYEEMAQSITMSK